MVRRKYDFKEGKKCGRKRIFPVQPEHINVNIPPEQAEVLREVGGGNMSKGVRKIIRWYTDFKEGM